MRYLCNDEGPSGLHPFGTDFLWGVTNNTVWYLVHASNKTQNHIMSLTLLKYNLLIIISLKHVYGEIPCKEADEHYCQVLSIVSLVSLPIHLWHQPVAAVEYKCTLAAPLAARLVTTQSVLEHSVSEHKQIGAP